MDHIISLLKEIQSDLVGIILPVIITAFASFITLIINSLLKIWLENKKNNTEQYKIMQGLYSEFKIDLLNIKLFLENIEQNQLYKNIKDAIDTYVSYKNDSKEYREKHKEQIDHIDEFIDSLELFLKEIGDLSNYLKHINIPAVPVFHPIIKAKVNDMFAKIQCFSSVVFQYYNNNINDTLFVNAIDQFNLSKFNSKLLSSYIELLDKWIKKY